MVGCSEYVSRVLQDFATDDSLESLCFFGHELNQHDVIAIVNSVRCCRRTMHLCIRACLLDDSLLTILAEGLRGNATLKNLDLAGNNFSGTGVARLVEAMRSSHAIEHFNIRGNKIGDDGAASIAVLLEQSTSLQDLTIDRSGIGTAGAIAIAKSAIKCPSLKRISMADCGIGKRGVHAFALMSNEKPDVAVLGITGHNLETGKIRVQRFHERQKALRNGVAVER